MELEEALRKADVFLKESAKKGSFLCSAFSSIKSPDAGIDEWVLHLCGSGKSMDCYVGDEVSVEESQSIGNPVKLEMSRVRVAAEAALSKAKRHAAGEIMVLISLHGSPPVWTVNFIMPNMGVTTVDVDAESGEITREERTSVLRK